MSKAVLRSVDIWTPLTKAAARTLGLSVEPLAPSYTANDLGVVLDRSDWVEMSVGYWMVAYRIVDQRGQPVIAELRIFPREKAAARNRPPGQWRGVYGAPAKVPPGGITARLLRGIKTQAFRAALREIVTRHSEALAVLAHPLVHAASAPRSNRGRKGRTDVELARIAAIYEKTYLAGHPAIGAVAKGFGLSLSQARDAVYRARVRRLLSAASKQGKGGGLLTAFGRTLLKQQQTKGGTYGKKR